MFSAATCTTFPEWSPALHESAAMEDLHESPASENRPPISVGLLGDITNQGVGRQGNHGRSTTFKKKKKPAKGNKSQQNLEELQLVSE